MVRLPTQQRRDLVTVAALFAVALAVRFAYVASVCDESAVRFPMVDARNYHQHAMEILAGDWLGNRVFFWDPLYIYLLAGLYGLFGHASPLVLFTQAFFGALTVVLVFFMTRNVFGYAAASIAALLACGYKPFLFYDALLLKTSFCVFLVALTLFLFLRAASRDRPGGWFAAGLSLGLTALIRGNVLLFAPVSAGWILFAGRGPVGRRLAHVGLVAAGACLMVFPVTLRNWVVGGDFVLTTSGAGTVFYSGNQRGNASGRNQGLPFVRANPVYEEDAFRAEAERRTGRTMKPSELSRFWFREGLREIQADPGHFLRHTWLKARLFLNHYEIPDNYSFDFFRERVAPMLRLPLPTYGWVLPLALLGMFFARRDPKAVFLALFVLTYMVSVVMFFNMSRYRIPVVPALLVFAGHGLSSLFGLFAARSWRALAICSPFLLVAYPVVYQDLTGDTFEVAHLNLGARLAAHASVLRQQAAAHDAAGDEGAARAASAEVERERDLAEAEFHAGLLIRPRFVPLVNQMTKLYLDRIADAVAAGRPDAALDLAHRLVRIFPRSAVARAALGDAFVRLERYEEAERAFRSALALAPRNASIRDRLARVRAELE